MLLFSLSISLIISLFTFIIVIFMVPFIIVSCYLFCCSFHHRLFSPISLSQTDKILFSLLIFYPSSILLPACGSHPWRQQMIASRFGIVPFSLSQLNFSSTFSTHNFWQDLKSILMSGPIFYNCVETTRQR